MKAFFYILLVTLFLTACSENFFDKPVDINTESQEPNLAVTAILNQYNLNENTFSNNQKILVSYSQNPLTYQYNENGNIIEDATITITGNNQTYIYEKENDSRFYKPVETIEFIPENSYTLTVEAPNFNTVTATQTMPQAPQITAVENSGDYITFKIVDAPNEQNFYLLQLFAKNSNDEYRMVYLDAFNTVFDGSGLCYSCLLFNDTTFNGEEVELTIEHFLEPDNDVVSFKLLLYATTQDYFKYDTTIRIAEYAQDNPFVEPVIIYNNIRNGYGIFSLLNKTEVEFSF